MLENRNNALPLEAGTRIALFGRSQFQYYKSGTGSGGMVNTAYVTGIREAILEREAYELAPSPEKAYEEWLPDHPFDQGCGWGTEPWFQEEMTLTEELVRAAAQEAERLEEEGDVLSLLFTSCVPWLNYTEAMMPYPHNHFSIPNICWGGCKKEKYLALEDGQVVEKVKVSIPATLLINHALIDGRHIGQFYANLDEELKNFSFPAGK